MKTTFFSALLLAALTSCMAPIAFKTTDKKLVYVRRIPVRSGTPECYTDSVSVKFEGQRFTMTSKVNLNLHALTLTLQDPNLYTALDNVRSGFTVYHYEYRGRLFMQITPVPKGFTDAPDEVEYMYVVTTDNVCAN